MSISDNALTILLSHLGQTETSNNQGPIVDWAIKNWNTTNKPTDETGWAKWCAGAVCTAYIEAGSQLIKKIGSLSVDTLHHRLKKMNLCYTYGTKIIQPGDLIFFKKINQTNVDLNHVGLIYQIQGDILVTVEGNSSNSVKLNNYKVNDKKIYGFAYIPY